MLNKSSKVSVGTTHISMAAIDPETRRLVDAALEDAWQVLKKDGFVDADPARMKLATKFAAAHASIHNHFNHDRHLNHRDIFKQNRSAALAEWRQLAA